MAVDDLVSRRRAIRILEEAHATVNGLLDRLPPRAVSRPGLGGGDWSPKDLVGHLESWEEYAIDAHDDGLLNVLGGWMTDAGLAQVDDVKLFADKYFLVFARK